MCQCKIKLALSLSIPSKLLISAGLIASTSAIWHLLCILGGPSWFAFARAPQQIIDSSIQGSLLAPIDTITVASLMFACTIFAFSAVGLIRKVPLLKPGLDTWQIVASTVWFYVGICFSAGSIEQYNLDKSRA